LQFNHAQGLLPTKDLTSTAVVIAAPLEIQPDSPMALYYLGEIDYAQHQLKKSEKLPQLIFRNADNFCRKPSGRCTSILLSPCENQAKPRRS
jgi:hypothetical protein